MSTTLPADTMRQIRALGSGLTASVIAGSWTILAPWHEKLGYTAPRVERDLVYADSERNRLDVHAPASSLEAGSAPGAPVFLFVHGGGFTGGDKRVPGLPAYDHVGAWAVRHGAIGVTMTYRLAPEFTYPAGAQDVAAAVAWTRANIAAYGGDPARIVVAGHSAGAAHVAAYLAGQGGGSLDGVVGAALLSGMYDQSYELRIGMQQVYYGSRPAQEVSTVPALVESGVPLLFSVAELDTPHFHAQAERLASAWYARHATMAPLVRVEGHNHVSEIASLGVDEDALGVPLGRFLARVAHAW